MSLKRTRGVEIRSTPHENQRRRLGHGNRRGLLARLMQLPDDLISAIQRIVIETQIHLSAPVRQLMNNKDRRWTTTAWFDSDSDTWRRFGWGGGGEFRGWRENIRRHLYALQGGSDTHPERYNPDLEYQTRRGVLVLLGV